MGRDVAEEANMTTKAVQKLVREGDLVAEVDVHVLEAEGGWSPYLSLDDAYRLDDVRQALRAGDIKRASSLASRIYRLTPVSA
jgi:Asp-tRNA(Asn)/Glu-tRNA(Gln) amidotransferase A subunit family amidase